MLVDKDGLEEVKKLEKILTDLRSAITSCPTHTIITKRMTDLARINKAIEGDSKKDKRSQQLQLSNVDEAEEVLSALLVERRNLNSSTPTRQWSLLL
jgi:hypothetical protein